MTTFKKGSNFENRVYKAVKNELDQGRLGFNKESTKTFQQKGYFSRDRNSDIVVDISIEVWLPSAPNWSLLWVCECKDYSSSIPVDDVEEFKAKLDQISGANRKGIIASTGDFQRGAYNYAQSKGIGLIRILPDDQVEHMLYQMLEGSSYPDKINSTKVEKALLNRHYIGRNIEMFARVDGRNFSNWKNVLKASLLGS